MTRVQFEIELPNADGEGPKVSGEGAVVRCERLSPALGHYEIAVFFQHLDRGCADALQAFLRDAID